MTKQDLEQIRQIIREELHVATRPQECLTTMSDIDLMAAAAIERNAIKRANRPRRARNASL